MSRLGRISKQYIGLRTRKEGGGRKEGRGVREGVGGKAETLGGAGSKVSDHIGLQKQRNKKEELEKKAGATECAVFVTLDWKRHLLLQTRNISFYSTREVIDTYHKKCFSPLPFSSLRPHFKLACVSLSEVGGQLFDFKSKSRF